MAEVLTGGGGDRPTPPWLKLAAGVAAAALLVGVGVSRWGRHGPPARPDAVPTSAAPSGGTPVSPPLVGDSGFPPRLVGVTAALPSGVRLLIGGPHPTGLGAGAPSLRRVPVPDGWEVARVTGVPAGLLVAVQRLQLSDTAPSSVFYLVRPDGSAVRLAAADEAVTAVDGTTIYTVRAGSTAAGTRPDPPGLLSVVSLSGRVLRRHPVPWGFDLEADTAAGLLVGRYRPPAGLTDLQILDHVTLAPSRTLASVGYVLAATDRRASWVPAGCSWACPLVVADLSTGARHSIALPAGYQPGSVAFSPDGRRLAVSYYGRHPQQRGGAAPGVVDVVDLRTGSRQRLPGVGTGIKQVADLSWTPDGRRLAVAVGWPDQDFRRVGLWPATGGPVRVLPGHYAGGSLSGALLAV